MHVGVYTSMWDVVDLIKFCQTFFVSLGCAFLKFETKEQALAAIEALNGKHKIEVWALFASLLWVHTYLATMCQG